MDNIVDMLFLYVYYVFIEMEILFKGEGYELKSRDIGCCFTT